MSVPPHSLLRGCYTVEKSHDMKSEDLESNPDSLSYCEMLGILAKQPGLGFCKMVGRKTVWVITGIKDK